MDQTGTAPLVLAVALGLPATGIGQDPGREPTAGREFKSLRYEWYAQDDRHASVATEPWGDVRLASEGLGSQLARACRALARWHPTTP
jgi:hypothetical protein